MKAYLTIILLILSISNCISQNAVEIIPSVNSLYPEFTQQIKKLNSDFDFQLRFWIHSGNTIPYSMGLFIMTQKNGKWLSNYYTINQIMSREKIPLNKYKVKKQKICHIENDSIWQYFLDNKILDLPDMNSLKQNFYYIDSYGKRSVVTVMDGESYTFEFITSNSYKKINYHCPQTFAEYYTHITELNYVTNIIKKIGQIINRKDTPC